MVENGHRDTVDHEVRNLSVFVVRQVKKQLPELGLNSTPLLIVALWYLEQLCQRLL